MRPVLVLLVVLSCPFEARAQPEDQGSGSAGGPEQDAPAIPAPQIPTPAPPTTESDDVVLAPNAFDPSKCYTLDLTPGAVMQEVTDEFALATPIPWTEFVVEGSLVDTNATVHTLLEPTLQQYRTSLSLATLPELAATIARFGYQLVGQRTIDIPHGQRLLLHLSPLPLVRKVTVDVDESLLRDKLFEDEVLRRMSVRAGSYLPWDSDRQRCVTLLEEERIKEYLFDEGYYDATVSITRSIRVERADLRVTVKLGDIYTLGKVVINCPSGTERRKGRCVDVNTGVPVQLAVPDDQIREAFKIPQRCLPFGVYCYGRPRFTRDQYQKNIANLKKRFQDAGYPSVRLITSEPRLGVDRKRKTVDVYVTIDQRRRIDLDFDGYDRDVVNDEQLRKQLTFNLANSADEVEIGESAKALTTYLQTRGFFDAHVTWTRERVDIEPRPGSNDTGDHYDKIVFKISMGVRRRVVSVQFRGNTERVMPTAKLRELVQTKESNLGGRLFGTVLSATSAELIVDQERIKEAYHRIGYVDAHVWPSASPTAAGLDNAALTAALIGLQTGDDLYVRFTIEEGAPTLLSRIVITGDGASRIDDALCAELLGELATELGNRDVAVRQAGTECAATIRDLTYKTDEAAATRDQLRSYLLRTGRGRANVAYEETPLGPHRMQAHYTVTRTERLKLGKVVIRGNFRTKRSVIYNVLDFDEGQSLTSESLAGGARKLRNTGLFEAVNIEMPELDCDELQRTCNSDVINAVVRVEERYNYRFDIGLELGYSSENGTFVKATAANRNVLGYGLLASLSTTFAQRNLELEAKLRIPTWLWIFPPKRRVNTTLTGLHRNQDTDRFGLLTTDQIGVEFAWTDTRPRTDEHSARVINFGPTYSFRSTSRNVDALRPIGADRDQAQVAVNTRTGAVGLGLKYEQRVDRNGQISPLAPEAGQYFEASAAIASPLLLGQDTFLKFSLAASKFIPFGKTGVFRADVRYDHGVPLGGAVLLPEVERFFAGGDSTVRGYSNERLATELIQVGLPPLSNVTQIRLIPAGGNIRVLGSLDAQVRIWRILAGALFTDAGLITNQWSTVDVNRKWGFVPDIPQLRPSVGMGLRVLTPFGIGALEYAVPLNVQLGDDPRGKVHFYFAARAQF